MKLFSLFKFKRDEDNIESLLVEIFNNIESKLVVEFKKDIYNWEKIDSIKEYECFIFTKFLINYSFSVLYTDIDKKLINDFSKVIEEVFSELHEKKYSSVFDYKDMKVTIDEKYNLFNLLRKENNPPECWHLIYSSLTGKNTVGQIESEVLGLRKAISLLNSKVGLNHLVAKFNHAIDYNLKTLESFDLAEISFRQNIRAIKKQLSSFDILKKLSSKK